MVISHFSHEHPLIIIKQVPTGLIDGQKIECYGCRKPMPKEQKEDDKSDDDVYGCELCKTFFLHKSCAQLPTEIVHKSHEQHSLLLVVKPPGDEYGRPNCYLCSDVIEGFLYHCDSCQIDLDIKCAFKKKGSELLDVKKDLILKHLDHEHPLGLLPRPATFHCDACDLESEDFSYQCSPCNYWIHRSCALLPTSTRRTYHPHPLSLCFRLPSEYHSFFFDCDKCKKQLYKDQHVWLYYCNLCRYFLHIRCMVNYQPRQADDLTIAGNLLCLPAIGIPGDIIQRFLLKVDSLPDIEADISIFSHNHRLKISYKHITENDIDDNDDEEILCDSCIQPITSPPYYCCAECKYFLHLPCAKLPSKLKYQNHRHTLILGCKPRIYDTFHCSRCKDISNGFYFSCEAEGCEFFLDVKCAVLPFSLMHESHGHPLLNIPDWNHRICNACERDIRPFEALLFRCKYCQFYLHLGCAMLPRTVSHRYDNTKHPLTLKFPPHDYHPRPFDCFKCQKEINPRYWLYHCEECDLSFHTYCIPRLGKYPGVKCGQRSQISSYHPHPLQHVRSDAVNGSTCHRCRKDMAEFTSFECGTCNFRLCKDCVLAIQT